MSNHDHDNALVGNFSKYCILCLSARTSMSKSENISQKQSEAVTTETRQKPEQHQRPVWTSGQWTSLGCSDIGFPVTALGGKRRPGLIVVPAPVCMSAVWCYVLHGCV